MFLEGNLQNKPFSRTFSPQMRRGMAIAMAIQLDMSLKSTTRKALQFITQYNREITLKTCLVTVKWKQKILYML